VQNHINPLIEKAREMGAIDAKIIPTDKIVFDPRSHLKCRFGCNRWGHYWTCPPNLHLSPKEFQEAFKRYHRAIFIKAGDPNRGQEIAVAIEKEAMLTHNCPFSFALALCVQCEGCAFPEPCLYPHLARPSMDGYGVDIGLTAERIGMKVEFDKDGKMLPAWYTMVLLD
jgi:predicted metal-binding protein